MNSPLYSILWPAIGCLLLVAGVACILAKKRFFSGSLLLVGVGVLGSWYYDRSNETITKLNFALTDRTLIKANVQQPELSLYHVTVCGLEFGDWEANLPAKDINTAKMPGSIVAAELRKRPLTGTYLKAISDMPLPQYTYVPPPEGREFDYVFQQPLPPGANLEHVFARSDRRREMAIIALAFRTDRATFDRIRQPDLEQITYEDFNLTRTIDESNITWWRKPTKATEIRGRNAANYLHYQRKKQDHFGYERIALTWDEDGLVQYFWHGQGLPDP